MLVGMILAIGIGTVVLSALIKHLVGSGLDVARCAFRHLWALAVVLTMLAAAGAAYLEYQPDWTLSRNSLLEFLSAWSALATILGLLFAGLLAFADQQDRVIDEKTAGPIIDSEEPPPKEATGKSAQPSWRPQRGQFVTPAHQLAQRYSPEQLPIWVIGALSEVRLKDREISEIRWAARREGKGNNAWYISTRSDGIWKVTKGGQGKTGPTVTRVKKA